MMRLLTENFKKAVQRPGVDGHMTTKNPDRAESGSDGVESDWNEIEEK